MNTALFRRGQIFGNLAGISRRRKKLGTDAVLILFCDCVERTVLLLILPFSLVYGIGNIHYPNVRGSIGQRVVDNVVEAFKLEV